MRSILWESKVHIWTQSNDVVHSDGEFLAVHATQGGVKAIRLPAGKKAEALERSELKQIGDTLFVEFEAGETICFRIID